MFIPDQSLPAEEGELLSWDRVGGRGKGTSCCIVVGGKSDVYMDSTCDEYESNGGVPLTQRNVTNLVWKTVESQALGVSMSV